MQILQPIRQKITAPVSELPDKLDFDVMKYFLLMLYLFCI